MPHTITSLTFVRPQIVLILKLTDSFGKIQKILPHHIKQGSKTQFGTTSPKISLSMTISDNIYNELVVKCSAIVLMDVKTQGNVLVIRQTAS